MRSGCWCVTAGGRLALVACVMVLCAGGVPSAQAALRVIPFPGTPDASPSSQVIFSVLRPQELRSVTVIGSRSGRHTGRLEMLPAGAGTAFVPSSPFTPEETVTVSAALTSPQAGTASGQPDATHLRFSFGVASRPGLSPEQLRKGTEPRDKFGYGPTQSFPSEPKLHPPAVTFTQDADTTSGDIFVTPQNGPQVGPMIMNSSGQLVWFHPLAHRADSQLSTNLAVQRYQGHPVLTWWQGKVVGGIVSNPSGDVLMDRHYRRLAVVHAGYGDVTDLHEFQLTPQGTAYLDSVVRTKANLTSVGGPANGYVLDYVIQEVDVKTGKVLWEWHSLGHVPINDSYQVYRPNGVGYDFFHLNSIQQLPGGNLLISARDTCAVYEINRQTGEIIWTVGGRHPSVKMGPGTRFWWQHDARLHGDTLSLFDDAALPQRQAQSSAEYLNVNIQAGTVSLIRRLTHYPPLLASAGGATETLPNGDIFVGWGSQPHFSEYTPAGKLIFDGAFPLRVISYRAFRFPWRARPDVPPSLSASPQPDGHVTVYASWNGATQMAAWRVLGGSDPHQMEPLGASAPVSGFETVLDVQSEPRYLAVQALNVNGGVLGTSRARPDPSHLAVFGTRVFARTSGGGAAVPVGCLAAQPCRVTVTIKSRGSVRGRSAPLRVTPQRAALVHVRLSATAQHELMNANGHRVPAQVIVRSSPRLPTAKTAVTLTGYSSTPAAGSTPIGFVSPAGLAGVLTSCYAPAPCRIDESLTASGKVIARTGSAVFVGANELAYLQLPLNGEGSRMLAQAKGNRLSADVTVRTDGKTTSHSIDLVRYG